MRCVMPGLPGHGLAVLGRAVAAPLRLRLSYTRRQCLPTFAVLGLPTVRLREVKAAPGNRIPYKP
jgi:hypothetical protein